MIDLENRHSEEFHQFVASTENLLQSINLKTSEDSLIERVIHFSEWADLYLELKKSEQQFKKIFEHNPVPICLVSREGYFIDVNKSCTDFFGYSKIYMTNGLKWQDVTVGSDIKPDEIKVRETINDKRDKIAVQKMFKEYIPKNGKPQLCYLQYTPIREPSGETIFFISIIISEQWIDNFKKKFVQERLKRNK